MVNGDSLRFRAVVFDLDGTLVDSLVDVAGAVNDILALSGVPAVPREKWPMLLGEGSRRRMEAGFAFGGTTLTAEDLDRSVRRFQERYAERMLEETRAFDGATEALERIAGLGIKVGVCTNKEERAARAILSELGLVSHITAVAGPDTYGVQKPHRDHVLKLLEAMGVEPAHAILVGDSVHDIEAAHNAGLPAVYVLWGYGHLDPRGAQPDHVIGAFADLVPILKGQAPLQ